MLRLASARYALIRPVAIHSQIQGITAAPGGKRASPLHGLALLVKLALVKLAEDRGFEPLRAFTQHAFQACALGH
jgi:hypothetical protein